MSLRRRSKCNYSSSARVKFLVKRGLSEERLYPRTPRRVKPWRARFWRSVRQTSSRKFYLTPILSQFWNKIWYKKNKKSSSSKSRAFSTLSGCRKIRAGHQSTSLTTRRPISFCSQTMSRGRGSDKSSKDTLTWGKLATLSERTKIISLGQLTQEASLWVCTKKMQLLARPSCSARAI
jgi:hypothetical protein